MSYKLEQSIVPPPGTDTTVACDFEISESSSKLPAFFPRKTKCTPARCSRDFNHCGSSIQFDILKTDLRQKSIVVAFVANYLQRLQHVVKSSFQ